MGLGPSHGGWLEEPRWQTRNILVSVDLAILVSCDVTVVAWDGESSSVSMGSGPAPSGLDLDILKWESVSYPSVENEFYN